jgi:hypothetical protein
VADAAGHEAADSAPERRVETDRDEHTDHAVTGFRRASHTRAAVDSRCCPKQYPAR